jgi:hypothetical protein
VLGEALLEAGLSHPSILILFTEFEGLKYSAKDLAIY